MSSQIPLILPPQPAFERADLWVSESNRVAIDWLDQMDTLKAVGLVIYGPAASGKTHLLKIFTRERKATILKNPEAAYEFITQAKGDVAVDDADTFPDEVLFHLYNHCFNTGGKMVLTAAIAPRDWPVVLKDWRSRLLSLPVVAIAPPDEETMAALLLKQLHDRQMIVDEGVIEFLSKRIDRSYVALRQVVSDLDHLSLALKRRVTIPLAREVLRKQV